MRQDLLEERSALHEHPDGEVVPKVLRTLSMQVRMTRNPVAGIHAALRPIVLIAILAESVGRDLLKLAAEGIVAASGSLPHGPKPGGDQRAVCH